MNGFDVCSSCRRYVKSRETRCPFCSAPHEAREPVVLRATRISRAQWLALGATVAAMSTGGIVGCSGTEPGGGTGQPERTEDAATHDGATDAATGDAATSCSVSGRSACGDASCDNRSQWCDTRYGTCNAIDAGFPFPSQCSDCPTCACVKQYLIPACSCHELDGGGIGLACHTCYGAPPARLERLVRRARRRAPRRVAA